MLRAMRICSAYFALPVRTIAVRAGIYLPLQAFAEWVPVRGLHPGDPDLAGCHRTLHFGDLATLVSAGVAELLWCCTSLCRACLRCRHFLSGVSFAVAGKEVWRSPTALLCNHFPPSPPLLRCWLRTGWRPARPRSTPPPPASTSKRH